MKNGKYFLKAVLFGQALLVITLPGLYGQDNTETSSAKDLADKLANPVSSLISAPFQSNMDFGIGPDFGSRYTLNVQPVVPVPLNKKLNFIGRIVIPVINQYNITGVGEREAGLADAALTGFISPQKVVNGFIWGAGPVLLLPIATNNAFASKKFGLGPSIVALKQGNSITFGILINQIWSVAGNEDRPDVNQFFFQPFVTHNWPSGTGVGTNLEGTHYWNGKSTNIWLNVTVTAVSSIGKQKVQWQIGPRFNLVAPKESRGKFGLRAGLIFLFPQ